MWCVSSASATTSPKAPMSTERRLSDFLGRWEIARDVIPAQGPRATLTGQATWSAAQDGAHYHESGVLRLQGAAPMTAERRYFWASDLSVFFEDGRFFHRVPAGGGQAMHFCDPDTYVVAYDFNGWPSFELRHRVTGPRKDYEMITRFVRAVVV